MNAAVCFADAYLSHCIFALVSLRSYEILGDPDKRAAFDDFGTADVDTGGFASYWEFQQSGNTATRDFYTGQSYVTNLTPELWTRRGVSEHYRPHDHGEEMPTSREYDQSDGTEGVPELWMVEFYAPWCSHCMKGVPQYKRAAVQLDGRVEFGAVNCDKQSSLCSR